MRKAKESSVIPFEQLRKAVKRLLTPAVAAARLDVNDRAVRRYCEQGRLASIQVGGTYLIDPDAVAKFDPPKSGNPNLQKSR